MPSQVHTAVLSIEVQELQAELARAKDKIVTLQREKDAMSEVDRGKGRGKGGKGDKTDKVVDKVVDKAASKTAADDKALAALLTAENTRLKAKVTSSEADLHQALDRVRLLVRDLGLAQQVRRYLALYVASYVAPYLTPI